MPRRTENRMPRDSGRLLSDSFKRRLNYLRISITDRCNLQCIYCMPRGGVPKLRHENILRYEEILRLVKIGADLGISKIRVTGGEPLVRKGVDAFLRNIGQIEGISDISLTTNGRLLGHHIDNLMSAGIRRLNISLDTLDPQNYARITGHNVFNDVWKGIMRAYKAGFDPIKINAVALRGINEHEICDLARLSLTYPFHVRFIEHMPTRGRRFDTDNPLLTAEIKQRVSELGRLVPVKKELHDGPARRFHLEGAKGEIGFISPLSHHFCDTCNRLRLTADGRLRVCLLSSQTVDLKTPLRSGCSDRELAAMLIDAAGKKPFGHGMTPAAPKEIGGMMSSIGG